MSEKTPKPDEVEEIYDLDPDDGLDEDPQQVVRDAVRSLEESRETESDSAPDAESELTELRERHLRALADFENYRKRSEKERAEIARQAAAEPLRAFVEIVDNLDRALLAEGSVEDVKAGVEMILKQMSDLLKRFGVEPIEAVGNPFDPTVHEAVLRVEDPAVEEQVVAEELQRGYRWRDRLLRPAMVKVSVPAAKPAGDTASDA